MRLSRSATSLRGNLAGKFFARWVLLLNSFNLSYPTLPLPPLVFAILMAECGSSSCGSNSSRERQRYHDEVPTTPEHPTVVDITDALAILDLQGTPKSSGHQVTRSSLRKDHHHPKPLQARKILFPAQATSEVQPNWTVAEQEGLVLFLMLHSSGREWITRKQNQFWDQAGTFIQQLLNTSHSRTGKKTCLTF